MDAATEPDSPSAQTHLILASIRRDLGLMQRARDAVRAPMTAPVRFDVLCGLAIVLLGRDRITAVVAASTLLESGLRWRKSTPELVSSLNLALATDPHFWSAGRAYELTDVDALFHLLGPVLLIAASPSSVPHRSPPKAAVPKAARLTVQKPAAAKLGMAKPAIATPVIASPTTCWATSMMFASPPAPALALDMPAPPAFRSSALEVIWAREPLEALGIHSTLQVLSLVARAHAIAVASTFADLLSPSTLHDLVPHAYQLETVQRVVRALHGRALLADEVGLGKTIKTLLVLREYQLRGMLRRALIVAPSALVPQWVGELSSRAGVETRTFDDAAFSEDPKVFLEQDGVFVLSLSRARTARMAPLVQALPWDLVVVDEAHHIKNRTTVGWKLVDKLVSRFLLLLTATPMETDLEELYNLVTLLKPGQFATPAAFKAQFVDRKDPTSPRNRERLRTLLGEVMVRNTRASCGLALPPRFVTTILVEPSVADRALYEAAVALVRSEATQGARSMLASSLLLEAGSSPHAVRATVARALARGVSNTALDAIAVAARASGSQSKLDRLVEIVRGHGGRALVFTRYRATLDAVVDALTAAGLGAVAFHGGLSASAKEAALARFAGTQTCLVATDLGSEGHNLQHCNIVVSFDIPWNPMLLEQRIGRLHRMGQTRDVHVYHLALKGSAEERLLEVLDGRLHLFELVVGEMDMVLGNLSDDRDLEERILALYAEARDDADVSTGFETIADELLRARRRYEDARALDDATFGEDFVP